MTRTESHIPVSRLAASLLLSILFLSPVAKAQDQLTAQALVERQQVFVGEPFLYQIRVDGSESPEKPNLRGLTDLDVQELGGQQNSSQSVTIINGRMSRVVQKGYVFNFRLTAKKAGALTIPPIRISADGKTVTTNPVRMIVSEPQESEDFKLRVSLSDTKAYVGQPVTMTVKWYIRKNVREFSFNLPVIGDSRFDVGDPRVRIDPERHLQVPVSGGEVIAEKAREVLDGQEFLTVTFRKILVPKTAGTVAIPQATVAGRVLQGYQQRRSPFEDFSNDDFFSRDTFGFGRQAVYENFVVPSNALSLQVLDLPAAGRPASFNGLIGDFQISAQAEPTDVNVGDPITVTVRVSGPEFLDNVELPALDRQPSLAQDFKIPEEQAGGTIEGRAKKFTQTLRARSSNVTKIPPLELSFFNPKSGSYEIARTEPIPLTVKGTRIVTASDAEGSALASPVQSEIESSEGGIAFNYEGPDVLVNQAYGPGVWLRSPAWLTGLAIPPIVYLVLLSVIGFRRWQGKDVAGRQARRAFGEFSNTVRKLTAADSDEYYAAMLEAIRRYLGSRLGLAAGAITFADVIPALEARAKPESIAALRSVFERCEAGRYAGSAYAGLDFSTLSEKALNAVKDLEQQLS